jgi:hypothetical protein
MLALPPAQGMEIYRCRLAERRPWVTPRVLVSTLPPPAGRSRPLTPPVRFSLHRARCNCTARRPLGLPAARAPDDYSLRSPTTSRSLISATFFSLVAARQYPPSPVAFPSPSVKLVRSCITFFAHIRLRW